MKTSIRVRVPATTANVGPGFDTLGIALRLYNTLELKLSRLPRVVLDGNILKEYSHSSMKMAMEAGRSFFRKTGLEERGLSVRVHGDVPVARGLGSSVTIRLGIVAGLNRLLGNPLQKSEVLDLVAKLEGHPDNAASALYGGLVVSGIVGDQVMSLRKTLPAHLKFVAAIPNFEVETKKARKLLPKSMLFEDAIHNVNRASLLVAAFWNEDYDILGDFLEDRLHQPYRATLIPQLFPCLNAAQLAGAIGGWLSGSGSTVMAMTFSHAKQVGDCMQKVFEKSGKQCRIEILSADNRGVTFET